MADRNQMVKGVIAAMKAMQGIQDNKNKLLMLKFINNEEFQNEFMQNMIKSKMDLQNKQAEKQFMSPLETEQYNAYKANPQGFDISSGKPKTLTPHDRMNQIFMKNQGVPEDQWPNEDKLFLQQYSRVYGKTGDQPITDAEGNITGYRPRGAVFQPKGGNQDFDTLFGGGQAQPTALNQPTGQPQTKYSIGQIVPKNGKNYKVVSFDKDGMPLVTPE